MPTIKQSVYHEVLGLDRGRMTSDTFKMAATPSPSPMISRPASALDHCHTDFRPRTRPKSTPHYGMKGHASINSSSAPSAKISRPKTAAVILGRTECERVHQLESEATRRHNLESHLPVKKSKPPPWQKNLEAPMVPVVTGPGYILSRSKSRQAVTLKEDFFDFSLDDSPRPAKTLANQGTQPSTGNTTNNNSNSHAHQPRMTSRPVGVVDALIAQLQQQISDLTLYLEEERMNHRQTKLKAEEFLKDKVDALTSQHQDHVRELDLEHQEELHKQKSDLEAEHREYQLTTEKQISRMAKEIEFLQGAFESYKSTLHTETWDKWKVREQEMNKQHAEDKQQAMHDFKMKMIQERNQERAQSAKEHQKSLDALRKENKKEMDGLVRRFANAAADYERLQRATAELEETKSELAAITQNYNDTCHQLTSTTHQLTDARVKLMDWEKRFQEKITLVDDKYRGKLQELMSQNTELKRLFVQKCGELFNEKTQSEQQTTERVKTAKETMESLIKLRQRADVSIAIGGAASGPQRGGGGGKVRPLSAPGTKQEAATAHHTAGEVTLKEQKGDGFISPYIYMEPDPDVEELREELLLSCRDADGSPLV